MDKSKMANDAFFDKLPRLASILEKDSVKLFLNLFENDRVGLAWGFVITPQTFNQMIVQNALRCAKVALEGKAPELDGYRANPNYMNQSGYFPLHQAAEMFSTDMIKLLFHYGALANLRTVGPEVIEGLLPLHVAVQNACLHKFLEDNLLPDKENRDYVYRLIQLLCLPEMKIFLDTTRLIAERTDDLLAELWIYIKDGKLAETAVLLLAAQKKIRTGSSFKANGNSVTDGDGFFIISKLCADDILALDSEISQKKAGNKRLKAEKKLKRMSWVLVNAINEAGEALDSYIRAHPEVTSAMQVSHVHVLERVSSILKNHGVFPTGECINTGNLCPYEQQLSRSSNGELPVKDDVHGTVEKAARKKRPKGWELEYTRRSFFPYWKSVLSQLQDMSPMIKLQTIQETEENWNRSVAERSSPISNNNLGLLGRIPQLTSNQQSRRLFGTTASIVLKLLKHA
ncbi:hypothetical protein QYE76_068592 [Lolium multiflorum]|uniref:Uncharacterized protein n=1 Tax=Lolium multiflorum TaxID=4521 RepID=A0AAD8SGK8_LOLMU|nr:hypothetical protein QYE76_068592 [Lolium multiflorum]